MSPLAHALLNWENSLFTETGVDPKAIYVPRRAFDILFEELKDCATELDLEPGEDPISGVGPDGRLWLVATEIRVAP